ncbi:MAG: hypothetical protein ACI8T1_004595 [Verrucomicrobiales bacterium]|jgi:hypothetical protein
MIFRMAADTLSLLLPASAVPDAIDSAARIGVFRRPDSSF